MDSSTALNSTGEDNCSSCSYGKESEKLLELNSSFRLHISQCSSLSSETDLSMTIEQELSMFANRIIDADELPAFEIRLISPLSRSPSPIDSDMEFDTPTQCKKLSRSDTTPNYRQNNPDFVTLQDINSQISPPSENEETSISRTNSLETIFEGVFLHTPPRKRRSQNSRSHLLEKVAFNRLHFGKENSTPASQEALPTAPLKQPAAGCLEACIKLDD